VFLVNDVTLKGLTFGFAMNSSEVNFVPVDLTGSLLESFAIPGDVLNTDDNTVMFGWSDLLGQEDVINPQSGGLLATLKIEVPAGTPSQIVNLDSAFFAPAAEFVLAKDGGGVIVPVLVDCGASEILIGDCADYIGEECVYEQSTPTGDMVNANLSVAFLVFTSVTGGGSTEATLTTSGPPISGFQLIPVGSPLYYNISTTATYSGIIHVFLVYDDAGMTPEEELALRMLHYVDPDWVDITVSVDTDNNIVQGQTTTLSPFTLGIPVEYICGDTDGSVAIDIDDVVYLIAFIFSGGPEPVPYESGDANCSGGVDIDDVVWLISYIFSGGYAPCDTDGDDVTDC
jgi:hypothetical protein